MHIHPELQHLETLSNQPYLVSISPPPGPPIPTAQAKTGENRQVPFVAHAG